MAEVSASYLRIQELENEQTLTLDSFPYWSVHEFDLYASDPEFPPADHATLHSSELCHRPESTSHLRGLADGVSGPESTISTAGLLDRQNQANFVMDLFHQRVEQSQVRGGSHFVLRTLDDSSFGVIEENRDLDMDGYEGDSGMGLEIGFDVNRLGGDGNSGLVVVDLGPEDEDDFFDSRRVSGSEFGEAPYMVSETVPFNCVPVVDFGSDLDEEESNIVMDDSNSEDDYGLDHLHMDIDDDASIHLCWDSLQLEDHRESNEDFEWEEVDGRFEADEEGSVVPIIAPEEEELPSENMGNLEWQVLFNARNMERQLELDHDSEPYYADPSEYEYDMLLGQFFENGNGIRGQPQASTTVVQNLPSVIMTEQDIEDDNAICAVCKDDIKVGEQAKLLPCSHRYHGDCIVPWLGIRNTCPVCRHELPTDDAEYEQRTQRGHQNQ